MYEIGRTFRNEGVDSSHSPEFTMLEAYEAYGDYDTMAELTRALVLDAAAAAGISVPVTGDGVEIDLLGPWRTSTVFELVSDAVGEAITVDTPMRRAATPRRRPGRWRCGRTGARARSSSSSTKSWSSTT